MSEKTQSPVSTPPLRASYDAVVVGGGAAGLAGAVTLGRARRSVLVVDAGQPRNAPAAHVHGYLSRDGMPPGELLAVGREEVASYGGEVVTGEVLTVERVDACGFRIEIAGGTVVRARRLLVATGLVDELPEIPGLREQWGRGVLHCPYCHGWEVQDRSLVILGTSPMAVHGALLWGQWTRDVTLVVHEGDGPDAAEEEQLRARGVVLVREPVAEVVADDDRLTGVRLESGRVVPAEAVVVGSRLTARSDLLASLGVEPVDQVFNGHVIGSYVEADPMGGTAAPGVWVAGNVSNVVDQVISAAAAGVRAGAALNADLVMEDVRRAVDDAREVSRPA